MDYRYVKSSVSLLDVAAAPQTALARAIRDMREGRGWSHDTLVANLGTQYGLTKANRTSAIEWEKKRVPSRRYRDALVALGVPDELWPTTSREEPLVQPAPIAVMLEALENQERMAARLDSVDARLQSLEDSVAAVADGVTIVLGLLSGGQEQGRAST